METKDYSNENLTVKVTYENDCSIQMNVSAKQTLYAKAEKDAIKKTAREISIPGYRKGRAPLQLVEKKFGVQVKNQAQQIFADSCFKEAQLLAKVAILHGNSQISFDLVTKDMSGDEIQMVFRFETDPVVPDIDYNIDISDITNEDDIEKRVDETITQISQFYAKSDVEKEQPIKDGNFVLLDIEDLDIDPPSKAFANTRFEVSKKTMAEWMYNALLGRTTGEKIDAVSKPNEADSDEIKKEFKAKNVRLIINEVQTSIPHDVNDELAVKVGVKSVEEMRNNLTTLITKQSNEEHFDKVREKVSEHIVEHTEFSIPKSLLEKEFSHRINTQKKSPGFEKKWKAMSKEEQETHSARVLKESTKALKMFYISKYIVEKNKLPIGFAKKSTPPTNMLEAMFEKESAITEPDNTEERNFKLSQIMLIEAQKFATRKVIDSKK